MSDSSFFENGRPERRTEDAMEPALDQQVDDATAPVQNEPADDESAPAIWEQVYAELHELARAYMARENRRITLQPTALVHEAFVKLSRQDPSTLHWRDRAHFFRIAARAMRQILVDHARRRRTQGAKIWAMESALSAQTHVTDEPIPNSAARLDILGLNEALNELARLDERKARVIELRFFAGLTGRQIGEALGISPKTVEADWYFTRAWLRKRLSAGTADGS